MLVVRLLLLDGGRRRSTSQRGGNRAGGNKKAKQELIFNLLRIRIFFEESLFKRSSLTLLHLSLIWRSSLV